MSESLAHHVNAALREALTKHLGTDAWTPESLRGRVAIIHPPHRQFEFYCLDGAPSSASAS